MLADVLLEFSALPKALGLMGCNALFPPLPQVCKQLSLSNVGAREFVESPGIFRIPLCVSAT